MGNILKIYLQKTYQGDIIRGKNNKLSFKKNKELDAKSVLSMPLSFSFLKDYPNLKHDKLHTFLLNLKSENDRWIKAKSIEHKFDADDIFSYFELFGLDCAGSIQFIKPGEEQKIYEDNTALTPVTIEQIGEDIKNIMSGKPSQYITDKQRLSIAGAENKIGLTRLHNQWYISNGSTPSTHIIKFIPADQTDKHISEYLSLKIIGKLLPTGAVSHCEFKMIGDLPCIISERYDRLIQNNTITRIHQEDFCQILSKNPASKYEMNNGPNANSIITFIKKYSNHAKSDLQTFVSMLFLNYLMLCPDAHGKNYSMVIKPDDIHLAPIYDFTSVANFPINTLTIGLKEVAMGIDGKKKYHTLASQNIDKFMSKNGLDINTYLPMFDQYCSTLPKIISDTFASNKHLPMSHDFQNNFINQILTSISLFQKQLKILKQEHKSQILS